MKPAYWIGIMALVGSVVGTIIGLIFFPENSVSGATTGLIIGIATGTGIFATQQEQAKKDKQ
jgi:hypothetical protein